MPDMLLNSEQDKMINEKEFINIANNCSRVCQMLGGVICGRDMDSLCPAVRMAIGDLDE